MNKCTERVYNGLIKENPTFVLMLGMCPTLADGGILMSDNVLQDGDIIESRFAVERRNRTIHSRMRDYLYELKHSDVLETSIIPLGDGVALSIKKKKEEKENR